MNPFLTESNLPFEAFNFEKLTNDHYLPALEIAIQEGKKEIDSIVSNKENPNFENTIESLEKSGKLFSDITFSLLGLVSVINILIILTIGIILHFAISSIITD